MEDTGQSSMIQRFTKKKLKAKKTSLQSNLLD